MKHDPDDFDDPAFRSAVRRAMGDEAAPSGLRRRVAAAIAAEALAGSAAASTTGVSSGSSVGNNVRSRWSEFRNARTLAIAAVTLLAVGFAALQVASFFELWPGSSAPAPLAATPVTFPVSFATAIVGAHDHCAKLADHHLIPGNDPIATRDALTRAEGIPVCCVNPGDGWQFKGAGLCAIENGKAAHLLFVRGGDTVSIFSLPAPESCHERAYSDVVAKHPVIGFTHQGALYCVVGSASAGRELTKAELEPVVGKMRASLGVASAGCDSDGWDGDDVVIVQTASAKSLPAPGSPHRQHTVAR